MFKSLSLILGVLIMSLLIVFLVWAWTEPTQVPPGGNVATPLNVSAFPQEKLGSLSFPIFYDRDNTSYYLNPAGDSVLNRVCLAGECRTNWPRIDPGFEVTAMNTEMIGSDRLVVLVKRCSKDLLGEYSCSASGTHTPTYKSIFLSASASSGEPEAGGSASAYAEFVTAVSASCSSPCQSSSSSTWFNATPGTAGSYLVSAGASYWAGAEALIQEYEQGYKTAITLKNLDPFPQPNVPVGVYVVKADGTGTILGKKEITYSFSPNETISIIPEGSRGPVASNENEPNKKAYAIDRLDSSNQEYYIIVKVYNYLTIYRQKVKWTFDTLQLLQ